MRVHGSSGSKQIPVSMSAIFRWSFSSNEWYLLVSEIAVFFFHSRMLVIEFIGGQFSNSLRF